MSSTPSRILIIDNDDDLVRALTTRLEHHGHQCVTANSGAQGISRFADGGVDLVITDLNMPSGDGIVVVDEIRRQSAVPIIIVSGFTDEYRTELRRLTRVSWLRKPFDAESLVDLVEMELALSTPVPE